MMDEQRSFDSTIMSMILGAADGGMEKAGEYVDRLYRYYGTPLHSYLMRTCRLSSHRAEEVLQQFVLEKLLCPDRQRNVAYRFLDKRREQPGLKFRAYLIRAMRNFVVSGHRKNRISTVSLDVVEPALPAVADEDEDEFSREWAQHLLREALQAVREQCLTQPGQEIIWQVFEARVVTPAETGEPPEPYDRLASRLAIDSPKQASNRLQTALRKLRAALNELVCNYLPTDGDTAAEQVSEEIADLLRIAGQQRPLGVLEQVADVSWLPMRSYEYACDADDLWSAADHAGIWRHLVELPISEWIAEIDARFLLQLSASAVLEGLAVLPDLWQHPQPPLDLLKSVKSYAKSRADLPSGGATGGESGLPTVINAVLYLAAIGTAQLRHHTRISRDSNRHFQERVSKILNLSWLDPATRQLFEDWLPELESDSEPSNDK